MTRGLLRWAWVLCLVGCDPHGNKPERYHPDVRVEVVTGPELWSCSSFPDTSGAPLADQGVAEDDGVTELLRRTACAAVRVCVDGAAESFRAPREVTLNVAQPLALAHPLATTNDQGMTTLEIELMDSGCTGPVDVRVTDWTTAMDSLVLATTAGTTASHTLRLLPEIGGLNAAFRLLNGAEPPDEPVSPSAPLVVAVENAVSFGAPIEVTLQCLGVARCDAMGGVTASLTLTASQRVQHPIFVTGPGTATVVASTAGHAAAVATVRIGAAPDAITVQPPRPTGLRGWDVIHDVAFCTSATGGTLVVRFDSDMADRSLQIATSELASPCAVDQGVAHTTWVGDAASQGLTVTLAGITTRHTLALERIATVSAEVLSDTGWVPLSGPTREERAIALRLTGVVPSLSAPAVVAGVPVTAVPPVGIAATPLATSTTSAGRVDLTLTRTGAATGTMVLLLGRFEVPVSL